MISESVPTTEVSESDEFIWLDSEIGAILDNYITTHATHEEGKNSLFSRFRIMTSLAGHLLGTELLVKTTSGETLRGELFWYVVLMLFSLYTNSYDIAESNSFVLQERIEQDRINYHWLKCSSVRDIHATGLGSVNIDSHVLPAIDVASMEAQEKRADEYYANYKSMMGVGVTREAQEVFDSLAKTMPCTWEEQVILCYRVRISPPYAPENCAGPDDNELIRVKKVLEGERVKLDKRRQSTGSKKPPANQ